MDIAVPILYYQESRYFTSKNTDVTDGRQKLSVEKFYFIATHQNYMEKKAGDSLNPNSAENRAVTTKLFTLNITKNQFLLIKFLAWCHLFLVKVRFCRNIKLDSKRQCLRQTRLLKKVMSFYDHSRIMIMQIHQRTDVTKNEAVFTSGVEPINFTHLIVDAS